MTKKLQIKIREILTKMEISSQQQLLQELKSRGIEATQPTISRILTRLGAVKMINEQNKSYYHLPQPKVSKQPIHKLVISVEDNGFVVVVKTYSGCANAVAQWLDEIHMENILGTIAGDNTIMVIPRDINKIDLLYEELRKQECL